MTGTLRWRLVAIREEPLLSRYLTGQEPAVTVISERLRRERLDKRLRRGGRFYVLSDDEQVVGTVFHGLGGFFFPHGIADRADQKDILGEVRRKARSFLRIHSIMGQQNEVDTLAAVFGSEARTTIDYELLAIAPEAMPPRERPPMDSLTLLEADESMWKSILPLQVAYEIEEVIPAGSEPNINHSKATLIESLRNHTVLLATINGEVIARVATNAHGFTGDQIGGVYTDPRYRGRGVARWLMTELLARLAREHRGASLFVKANNEIAINLYRNLGFSFESPFRIRYYQ